jgi:hypothetical protein
MGAQTEAEGGKPSLSKHDHQTGLGEWELGLSLSFVITTV